MANVLVSRMMQASLCVRLGVCVSGNGSGDDYLVHLSGAVSVGILVD